MPHQLYRLPEMHVARHGLNTIRSERESTRRDHQFREIPRNRFARRWPVIILALNRSRNSGTPAPGLPWSRL